MNVGYSLKVIAKLTDTANQAYDHHIDIGQLYYCHQNEVANSSNDQTNGQNYRNFILTETQLCLEINVTDIAVRCIRNWMGSKN